MYTLTISDIVSGRAMMYEKRGRQGRRFIVPTYVAYLRCNQQDRILFEFAVTRDATDVVLGIQDARFGAGGECPPHKPGTPYQAVIHQTKLIPFGLRLYEPWCRNKRSLFGTGTTQRTNILIHFGPARSEGCFTVARGKAGLAAFEQAILALGEHPNITVLVEPRT